MGTRVLKISVAALVVLGAACGSTAAKHAATRPPTPPKLTLAKAGAGRSAADAAQAPGPLVLRPQSYVLDGTLPDLGTSATVYRWTAHSTSLAEVTRLAAALGIDATPTTTSDGYQASDTDASLTVFTTGGTAQVSYYLGGADASGSSPGSVGSAGGGTAPDATPPPDDTATSPPKTPELPVPVDIPPRLVPVDVPNAGAAETIARALLDQAGVLEGAQWDPEVIDSGGIAVSCAVGEKCTGAPAQVSARTVTFHLLLAGVRVRGVEWSVTVGEHRRIESVSGEWGSATVLGTYDLRSTADAFAALQHGDANSGGREAVVDDVPVQAQDTQAQDVPVKGQAEPLTTGPSGTNPIVVHVTGAKLGLARWDAVDGNRNVIDLVPTYLFQAKYPDSPESDIEELALDPAAIDFAKPISPPVPLPVPEPYPIKPGPNVVTPDTGIAKPTPAT